jgi:hypothetical protein
MEHITYDNYFTPNINKFVKVNLDVDKYNSLSKLILLRIRDRENKIKRKLNENEVKIYKKIYMKTAGDLVLEQLFNLHNIVKFDKIFDEENKISNLNTLIGKNIIDVITFDYGLFPMVYKRTYKKTIFICMVNKKEFYVCGIGSPKLIEGYSNSKLLKSDYYRLNGKTCFYSFDRLTPLSNNLGDFLRLIS